MMNYGEYAQLKKNEKQIDKKLWECFCCFFTSNEQEGNDDEVKKLDIDDYGIKVDNSDSACSI